MSSIILIDGPPGVGKTTLGEALTDILPSHRLILEMEPDHPLHPVPVGSIGADFGKLAEWDVGDVADLILGKWEAFLSSEVGAEGIILESYPYQSHLRVLWQMNAPEELLSNWLGRLHRLLEPSPPVLVMLRFGGDEALLRRVYNNRGRQWMEFMIDFAAKTPYGRAHDLNGYEGAMRLITDYHAALRNWSQQWPFTLIEFEAWQSPPADQAAQVLTSLADSWQG